MDSDDEYFDAHCDISELKNDVNNIECTESIQSETQNIFTENDIESEMINPSETEVEDESELDKRVKCESEIINPSETEKEEESELDKRVKCEALLIDSELQALQEKSLMLKNQGNNLYKNGLYEEAIKEYSDAINTCPLKFHEDHAVFYANRAVCLTELDKLDDAIKDCTEALNLKPAYLKVLLRRAKLYEKTDKLTESLEDYRAILKIDSRNWDALHAEQILPEKIKLQQEKLKEEMMVQLKQLGNLVLKPFGLSTDNFQMVQDSNTGGYSINFRK